MVGHHHNSRMNIGCSLSQRGSEYGASAAEGFTVSGADPSYAPDLELEPRHQVIRVDFDIPEHTVRCAVTTTVVARRAGTPTLVLDGVAFTDFSARSTNGEIACRYDGEKAHISWSDPFEVGEEREVEVTYEVVRPVSGMQFMVPDETYRDRPTFAVTDHETERARYWLACVDYPAVRTTYDFHLTSSAEHTILANGVLESETVKGDRKTAHWILDFPCPSYLCCIAVGSFTRFDDRSVGDRPIAYFAPDTTTPETLERTFGRTPEMMEWIQERLGVPFPFKKYFQFAVPEIGGAMENISLVSWDDRVLLDETWAKEMQRRVDSVNVHEMAHSYFGDAVVCRHFEHSWLKESWATYIETVWFDEVHGIDERDRELETNAEDYFGEADGRYMRPIVTRRYDSSFDLFDMHLYPGGAWRIHMLRCMLGDDVFWPAVTDYLETYSERVVETEDFRRKLEEHSGINLVPFFEQWIHSPGYPQLKVRFKHDSDRGEGTLEIEQKQKDEKKGVGLFTFDLDVVIQGAEEQTTTVHVDSERHVLVLAMKEPPERLAIDPDYKVLFKLDFDPGEDILIRNLDSERVRPRIQAVRELVKAGTRKAIDAVAGAYKKESFWGVRVAISGALGKSGSPLAIERLIEMLAAEDHPLVQWTVAQACGQMRDGRLRTALLKFLDRDLPYKARATALESLGSQHDHRDREVLERWAEDSGWHCMVRNGALVGLGRLRSPEAHDYLARRLRYGEEPERARPTCIQAFGASALFQPVEVRRAAPERLVDLTRDPKSNVRMQAASALSSQGDPSCAGALDALLKVQPHQDSPSIRRWLRKLRKGAPGQQVNELTKQVEKLEDKIRKLEGRLGDAEARLEVEREASE